LELSSTRNPVGNLCANVSNFQPAKIGVEICSMVRHLPLELLDGTAHLSTAKRLRETRHATRRQKDLRGRLQRIARQEDETLAEVGLLALQEPIETRAIEIRHAHVA